MRSYFFSNFRLTSVVMFTAVVQVISAATLQEGKAQFDAPDYPAAAATFDAVRTSGADQERAEAAAFQLRALGQAGDHAGLLAAYEGCLAAAAGTQFEAECKFELAKSTQVNAKDTTSALTQYNTIIAQHPDNVFAASGSYYQRAVLELDELKSATSSHASIVELVSGYGTSPFLDDALVLDARAAVILGRLDLIDAADSRLTAMQAPELHRQKVQFQRGEFHAKAADHRPKAIYEYTQTYKKFSPSTNIAAVAKIRAADLVPRGNFEDAFTLYQEVLSDHPSLGKSLRDWAKWQSAICQFQLGNREGAQAGFQSVLLENPAPQVRASAEQHLRAMDNPDSFDNFQVTYDRAFRYWKTGMGLDEAFMSLQEVLVMSRKPFFTSFIENPQNSRDLRAEYLYRVSFAKYFSGLGKEALDQVDFILSELQPQSQVRIDCQYMKAFLLGRGGRWNDAVGVWRDMIESNPEVNYLPEGYMEYSRALHLAGDPLAAIFALEEMRVVYPVRMQAEQAERMVGELLLRHPHLRDTLQKERPAIVEKGKLKKVSIAKAVDLPAIAPAVPTTATGGAE